MAENKASPTPIAAGTQNDKDKDRMEYDALYQEQVDSLLYFENTVRSDISYTVERLSRYCAFPKFLYLTAAKRIFQYLMGTKWLGIEYKRNSVSLGGY